MSDKFRRRWLTAGVLVLALLGPLSPVSADVPPGPHSGSFGPHFLRDRPEFGGARCNYPGPAYELTTIRVRPPSVYAFDKTAKADSQVVGWRYVIESSSDGLSWTPAVTSSAKKAEATENKDAPFTARTYTFSGPADSDYHRVAIRMHWYAGDSSTVRGSAEHVVEFQDIVGDGFPTAVRVEPCKGDTPLLS